MATSAATHGGRLIKTIGDEVMCTFDSANDAVDAAIEMHQGIEELTIPDRPNFVPPNIYVGIQFGPVISEAGDVFGDAVNVAARMVALAKERQIITTEETVELLSEDHREATRCIDKTTIKGKSGEVNIYEVVWEQQDATVMLDDSMESVTLRARLEIKYFDTILEIDESRPTVSLGRQPHNDVIVNDRLVSRSHARIEYRRGKFILVDQSSNGTFALIQGKKAISLKRDEATLLGHGIIGLGKEPDPNSPDVISYTIKM
jgi:adenylate cyclase